MKRILLAEDSHINQIVCLGILQSLGFDPAVANDGAEAVAAAREEDFALILMDVHMPIMDGVAATAAIRDLPRYRNIPIVALTADALMGSRERYLEAGMTDYLAKPFTQAQIRQVLDRHLGVQAMYDESGTQFYECHDGSPAIDLQVAKAQLPGDETDFRKYLKLFREECACHIEAIRLALQANNYVELRRAAHTLKSAADLFHARPVMEHALCLEEAVRNGPPDEDRETLERFLSLLECEWKRLDKMLADFLKPRRAAPPDWEIDRQQRENYHADGTHR